MSTIPAAARQRKACARPRAANAPDTDRLAIDLLQADGTVRPLEDLYHEAIHLLLERGLSVTEAAARLGIGRSTVYQKLRKGGDHMKAAPAGARLSTPRQDEVLALLARPQTAAHLARRYGASRQALHNVLAKLVDQGRVERLVTPGRRPRFVRTEPADSGQTHT